MKRLNKALLVLGVALLQACSSAPTSKPVSKPSQPLAQPERQTELSAEDYIERARQSAPSQRNLWLLKAAQQYQLQSCDNSIRMVSVLAPELTIPSEITQAKLILAECYVEKQQMEDAARLMPELALQQGFDQRIHQLKSQVYQYQKNFLLAANHLSKLNMDNGEKSRRIWQLVQQLTDADLKKARLRYPSLQPWVQLSQIVRRQYQPQSSFAKELNDWQQRYPQLVEFLSDDIQRALLLAEFKPRNISVLLPLSGRLKQQANAIREGILSAYFQQSGDKAALNFIDTNVVQGEAQLEQVKHSDFIIGPLLKDKIEQLTSALPADIPVLALNTPEKDDNTAHFFYALAPEDEAKQIARHLFAKGFKTPVVIASSSSADSRMANAFKQEWFQLSEDHMPEQVSFTDNKSMRRQVESLLDVEQSKQRIKQMEKHFRKEVHGVPRNRQDIDVMVVFASAGETELLNPIIESSISPFAGIMPVYASSRSFSQDLSKNSIRDLRNLNFIDMPWILDKQKWKKEHEESQTLWPQRRDSLQRLYAMGYDSFNLLGQLKYMQLFPQYESQQATGKLSLKDNRILRQLSWGKILKNQVVHIGVK